MCKRAYSQWECTDIFVNSQHNEFCEGIKPLFYVVHFIENKHRKTGDIAISMRSVNKPYTTDLHSALREVCSEFVQTLRTDPAARTAVTPRHCYTGSPPTVTIKPVNHDHSV